MKYTSRNKDRGGVMYRVFQDLGKNNLLHKYYLIDGCLFSLRISYYRRKAPDNCLEIFIFYNKNVNHIKKFNN